VFIIPPFGSGSKSYWAGRFGENPGMLYLFLPFPPALSQLAILKKKYRNQETDYSPLLFSMLFVAMTRR